MDDEDLSPEELAELEELMPDYGLGYPKPKERAGLFSLFNKIIRTENTTKVANINDDELSAVRNLKEGEVLAKVVSWNIFEDYFKKQSEIILASSDSKMGFLIRQATTSRKEIETKSKSTKKNRGWFKSKKDTEVEM